MKLDWYSENGTKYWTKDKKNYYFKYENLPVDYSTFKKINAQFLVDKNHLYTHLDHVKFIKICKVNKLKAINNITVYNNDTIYFTTKTQLKKHHIGKLNSFHSLSDKVIKINNEILIFGEPLQEVNYDLNSFNLIDEILFGGLSIYTKDKNHVFLNQSIVKGANPNTFELLGNNYSKDKKGVFYKGVIIKNADSKTYEFVGWEYAKDTKYVYRKGVIVPNADAKTFKVNPNNKLEFFDKNKKYSL